jgi:hypothetical protein
VLPHGDGRFAEFSFTEPEEARLMAAGWVVGKRWEMQRELRRGGQAAIWLAWDSRDERWVAVKYFDLSVLGNRKEVVARFRQEAERARSVGRTSPRIVEVVGFGEDDGRGNPYLVLELAERGSVADRFARCVRANHHFPRRLAVKVLRQLGEALEAVRLLDIAHRDIKPSNLLLDAEDNLLLSDFGIAQHDLDTTMTSGVLGTAPYLAPERWRGERATHATDVYAAAVVAYELLCRRLPFDGSAVEVASGAISRQPVNPASLRKSLPEAADRIIMRGLAKSPQERWATAREMTDELCDALDDWARGDSANRRNTARAEANASDLLTAREKTLATRRMPRNRAIRLWRRQRRRFQRITRRLNPQERADRRDLLSFYIVVGAVLGVLAAGIAVWYLRMLVGGPLGHALASAAGAIASLAVSVISPLKAIHGNEWLWFAATATLVTTAGVLAVRRRSYPGVAAVLAISAALVVLAWPAADDRAQHSAASHGQTRKHQTFWRKRHQLGKSMKKEAARWEGHYRRWPNHEAHQNTRRNFAWGFKLVWHAKPTKRGRKRMSQARHWLGVWTKERKAMQASGNW